MKNTSKNKVRLFFALWPNAEERAALAFWQGPLQKLCGGRPVPENNLHNTLVFLGNVEAARLEALQLAAQEVSEAGFDLALDVARYWGHNHIVYAAPSQVPPQLIGLVDALKNSLQCHHFSFDQRVYKPHVTLLRHAHFTDSPLPAMPAMTWDVKDFALVQSIGGAEGVRYERLFSVPLAAQGKQQ